MQCNFILMSFFLHIPFIKVTYQPGKFRKFWLKFRNFNSLLHWLIALSLKRKAWKIQVIWKGSGAGHPVPLLTVPLRVHNQFPFLHYGMRQTCYSSFQISLLCGIDQIANLFFSLWDQILFLDFFFSFIYATFSYM